MVKKKTKMKNAIPGLSILLLVSYLAFLIFLMIMPPFFVMDRASQGRIHAPVGHHLFWKPPGATEVGPELMDLFPEEYSAGAEAVDWGRFTVSVNKIRLAIFSIFGTGVYLMARFLLRRTYIHENKSRYP